MRKLVISLVTALGAVAAMVPTAQAASVSSIVFFGDSLSDTGNIWYATGRTTPAAPYFQGSNGGPPDFTGGQWSDWLGPSWPTLLAARFGLAATPSLVPGGNNFAYGGARTGVNGAPGQEPWLDQQVGQYLAANTPNATTLFSIVIGGNDVANNLTNPAAIASGVGSIVARIQALYAAGGRQFLVGNVPDIGTTPLFRSLGNATAAGATQYTQAWNAALAGALSQLNLPGADIDLFDLYGLGKRPEFLAQFANTTAACFISANNFCPDPTQYVYWDSFHPTSASHRLIAFGAAQALGVPEPQTWALLVLAALGLVATRRTRA